jgi:hypothetical protein
VRARYILRTEGGRALRPHRNVTKNKGAGLRSRALGERPPTEAALFVDLVKIDHAAMTERGHILSMATTSKKLTRDELASLLKVANTSAVLEPPAVIPAEHSARLIELG